MTPSATGPSSPHALPRTRARWRASQAAWLLLVLIAFVLRVYRLDAVALRGDESFTVLFVAKPLAQMWREVLTVEPNPPLMYFLLRGWLALAGTGEFAARFFSVFWGVLCVPLLYRLALEFFAHVRGGRMMAVSAALLLAVNPYQIWHSQDVRNYTLWPALSLLALVFFWRWRNALAVLDNPAAEQPRATAGAANPVRWLGLFVAAELAALYTHYYEVFILLALNLYAIAFFARRVRRPAFRRPLAQWFAAQALLAALYLPYTLLLSNRVALYGEGSGKQGVSLWDIWTRTLSTFTLGETLDADWRAILAVPLALLSILVLYVFWRRERRGLFLLLYAGIPTAAVFVLNLFRPLFLERYLNGVAPAYYLLFGYGLGLLTLMPVRRSWQAWAFRLAVPALVAGLALPALGNYYYNPAYAKSPDWKTLAASINAGQRPGDVILQNFPETSLVYYDRSQLPLVVYPKSYLPDAGTDAALAGLNSRYRRIWFIPAAPDFWDPDQYVETWLDRHDDLKSESQVGTFRLELYETPTQFLQTMRPSGALFGSAIELAGSSSRLEGSNWRLVLYWRARAPVRRNYTVSIELLAKSSGEPLVHTEHSPANGELRTTQWRRDELAVDSYALPAAASAGAFRIMMLDPATSAPLKVAAPGSDSQADALLIDLPASK